MYQIKGVITTNNEPLMFIDNNVVFTVQVKPGENPAAAKKAAIRRFARCKEALDIVFDSLHSLAIDWQKFARLESERSGSNLSDIKHSLIEVGVLTTRGPKSWIVLANGSQVAGPTSGESILHFVYKRDAMGWLAAQVLPELNRAEIFQLRK